MSDERPRLRNHSVEWVLPWAVFSQHGKYYGVRPYLVLQAQCHTEEAATKALNIYRALYPELGFIMREQGAPDVITLGSNGIVFDGTPPRASDPEAIINYATTLAAEVNARIVATHIDQEQHAITIDLGVSVLGVHRKQAISDFARERGGWYLRFTGKGPWEGGSLGEGRHRADNGGDWSRDTPPFM